MPYFDDNMNIIECIEDLTQGNCKDGEKYTWDLNTKVPTCMRDDCCTVENITKGCEEGTLPYMENGIQTCYEEFSQVISLFIYAFVPHIVSQNVSNKVDKKC